ncbi:MAG: LuxR C-terminal-related transcriptional regulator [Fuerstiella sp.]
MGEPNPSACIYGIMLPSDELGVVTAAAETSGYGLRQHASREAFHDRAAASALGCAVICVSTPQGTIDDITAIAAAFPSLPIVILLNKATTDDAIEFMKLGVSSVLTKPYELQKLVTAISTAVESSLKNHQTFDACRDAARRIAAATPKELEVLDMIMGGQKNKQIAASLGVTVRAVEDRRFRLMRKVGVESVAELVALAISSQYYNQGLQLPTAKTQSRSQLASCLKGIEIWEPESDAHALGLSQSVYRDAAGFEQVSAGIKFCRGEGLPGRIWQQQTPMFMRELIKTEFLRTAEANIAGMTTALGFPIFCDEQVQSVVLLLLETRRDSKATFESWRVDPDSQKLRLIGGTYINCDGLRRLSEFIHLPVGEGICGVTAANARPYVSCHPAEDRNAVRGLAIEAQDLSTVVGIPLTDSGAAISDVFLCMNSRSEPVFNFVQTWKPSEHQLKLTAEIQNGVPSLHAQTDRVSHLPSSLVSECLTEKRAVVTHETSLSSIPRTSATQSLSMAVAIPTFIRGEIVSILILGN